MLIATALLTTSLLASIPAAVHALPGDIDNDGAVTVADAAIASRVAAQLPTTSENPLGNVIASADVASAAGNYRDNRVDWHDVARILRVAGGLEAMPDEPVAFLLPIRDMVNVAADTTKDYALTTFAAGGTGVEVKGHVSDIPANTTNNVVMFVNFIAGGGYSGRGTGPDEQGNYRLTLPPDDYSLYYGATVEESLPGGSLSWDYKANLNRTVAVSGPATVDITAAPPPPPGQLTGVISATNIIPTALTGISQPSSPGDPAAAGLLTHAHVADGTYVMKGVPVPYVFSMRARHEQDPAIVYSWTRRTAVAMPSDSKAGPPINLPHAVPVSFLFSPPAGAPVTAASFTNNNANEGTLTTQGIRVAGSNLYQSAFVPGTAQIAATLTLADSDSQQILALCRVSATVPTEGGEVQVPLPALPELVTFRGRVTLPDDSAARGLTIAARPLFGMGGTTPYQIDARATTDADGRFSMPLIPGRYSIEIPAWPF